jgi:hypothetical protein
MVGYMTAKFDRRVLLRIRCSVMTLIAAISCSAIAKADAPECSDDTRARVVGIIEETVPVRDHTFNIVLDLEGQTGDCSVYMLNVKSLPAECVAGARLEAEGVVSNEEEGTPEASSLDKPSSFTCRAK